MLSHVQDWNRLTERIGFWIDLDDAYRTLDPSYIESVWWALKTIHDRGLLFERLKVVPYCTRDGTALSSHELGQPDVYRDVDDPSVYVRFPVTIASPAVREGDNLLVWTTTPWTLVSNAAVAVDPDLDYVRARTGGEEVFMLAEALLERVLGPGAEVLDRFPGRELEGTRYDPPFAFIAGEEYGPRGHTVLIGDFVTAEDGTGLVHTAIAFGEDDFRLGEQYGLKVVNPVRTDGTYDERIGPYAGRWVKDADPDLVEDLRARGKLLRAETYRHSYPHCWRCGTPLLYYAKPSWYIGTSEIKDRLLAANETVNWHPEHVKHGRFGKWLESNVDWALSRERYWGTPLPVWRCEGGHTHAVGSFDELERAVRRATRGSAPPVRRRGDVPVPRVRREDAPHARGDRRVVRLRLDAVRPVARATLERGALRGALPGRLHLRGARPDPRLVLLADRGLDAAVRPSSYRNVVCLGLILDEEGRKMSKSLGNVVAPWEVIDRYGADAFRWYFFTSKYPWDGYRFSLETIGESVRQFLLQLWNMYGFYVLYANANEVAPDATGEPTELDRWVRSRLSATVEIARERLDDFDATGAGRAIAAFVDDLSNWYVRRSRRRFWDGDPAAFETLRTALVTVAQLLAPFTPFLADEIYDNLDGREPSVHLTDFPVPDAREPELEQAMAVARETVRLGLAARGVRRSSRSASRCGRR